MPRTPSQSPQQIRAEAARLLRRAATLTASGDVSQALAAQQRAQVLLGQIAVADAMTGGSAGAAAAGADRTRPARQVTLAALDELGVPVSPREIGEYARTRFDTALDQRIFTSLRRDERRAWASPRSHRPVYIVPALAVLAPRRLLPMRGKLALSDWSLERRLMGPWSERVDHLTATRNVARQYGWLRETKPGDAERLAPVALRYAATVPDALGDTTTPDPQRIEAAVQAELDVLGAQDAAWRADAASRARELLAPEEQLWGVEAPALMEQTG